MGAKSDWDFRIFNPCGKFRRGPVGPVSQIHSPHHVGTPVIFKTF